MKRDAQCLLSVTFLLIFRYLHMVSGYFNMHVQLLWANPSFLDKNQPFSLLPIDNCIQFLKIFTNESISDIKNGKV